MSVDYLAQTKQFYNSVGDYFSITRRKPLWPEVIPFIERIKPGMTVVDLGCGDARLAKALPKGVDYLGVDFSSQMLRNASRVTVVMGDITESVVWKKIPKADVVFCVAVLHHLPYPTQHEFVLRQIKAHLTPGGFAVVTVWNCWQKRFWRWHLRSWRLKLSHWRWLEYPFDQQYKRFLYAFDRKLLEKLSFQAGFSNARILRGKNLVMQVMG